MTTSFFPVRRNSFLERKTSQKRHNFFFFSFRNTYFDNSYLLDISRNSLCNFSSLCLKLKTLQKKKLNQKASKLKEESLKTCRSSQRQQKKFWQLSTLWKKKVLKCSWFLWTLKKLSNSNSNIHDLRGYIQWNPYIWIRYLQTEMLQSWQNKNVEWKHDISKRSLHSQLCEVKVTTSSLLLFAYLLSISSLLFKSK